MIKKVMEDITLTGTFGNLKLNVVFLPYDCEPGPYGHNKHTGLLKLIVTVLKEEIDATPILTYSNSIVVDIYPNLRAAVLEYSALMVSKINTDYFCRDDVVKMFRTIMDNRGSRRAFQELTLMKTPTIAH